MEKGSKRELSFDIAKALAIILVVIYHCDNFPKGVHSIGTLFYMPLFMFVSGYFFHYRDDIKSLKELLLFIWKKIKKIYCFYLKYEIIFLALRNIFFNIGFYSTAIKYGGKYVNYIPDIKSFIIELIKIIFGFGREIFAGTFWFLIALIIIILGYAIMNYFTKWITKINKNIVLSILAIVSFIIGCLMRYYYNIPRFSPACTLLFFFHLGNMLNLKKEKIQFNNVYLAIFCLIILIFMNIKGYVAMNNNLFTDPFFLLICSLSGIYLTMYISKFIENKTKYCKAILCYIGKNTLVIMAIQFIAFKLAMLIQFYVGAINYDDLAILTGANNANWWYLLYVLFGIGIPLLYGYIIDKIKNIFKKQTILKNVQKC